MKDNWNDLYALPNEKEEKEEKLERNLKSWSVKLPEETIEEIERMYEASGLRYKNQFMEHLIHKEKVNILMEGKPLEELIHPTITKSTSGDIYELAKLTKMIHELFVHQLEKFSVDRYSYENLENKYETIRKQCEYYKSIVDTYDANQHETFIQEQLRLLFQKKSTCSFYTGTSGVGKSHAAKIEIKKAIKAGKQVFVLDPQGEYGKLARKHNGIVIRLGENNIVNPLEIHPRAAKKNPSYNNMNYLTEKILFVYNIIECMIKRTLHTKERKILLNALEDTYRHFGITRNTIESITSQPILQDVVKELHKYQDEGEILADELQSYIEVIQNQFGGMRNFSLYHSPMIVFDMVNTPRDFGDAAKLTVFEFIASMVQSEVCEESLIVFDECFLYMDSSYDVLTNMIKKLANANTHILATSQMPIKDRHNTFLTPFDTIVQFRTSQNDIKHIDYLSEEEKTMTRSFKKGDCFVCIQHEHGYIKSFFQFPDDKDASTDPSDYIDDIFY